MKYLRVDCQGSVDGKPPTCNMTGIQVCIPDGLAFEHAKAYAIAQITQELSRYGLDEALRGIGLEPST